MAAPLQIPGLLAIWTGPAAAQTAGSLPPAASGPESGGGDALLDPLVRMAGHDENSETVGAGLERFRSRSPTSRRGSGHWLLDPALLEAARKYLATQTAGIVWRPLVPEGTLPPVTFNRQKMEPHRPALRALRYDPARYPTYLDQLGVAYPAGR